MTRPKTPLLLFFSSVIMQTHPSPVSSPHASLADDQTALILLRRHAHIHMHAIHPTSAITITRSCTLFHKLIFLRRRLPCAKSLFPFPEDMSTFADPNAFHLDEGTIITRHGTRRDMRRDDTANVNTVILRPHCRRSRSRSRSHVVVVVRLRHIPATTTPRYARATRRNLTEKGRKAARRRSHGFVGTRFCLVSLR